MSQILAIDPGTDRSAWLIYDRALDRPVRHGYDDNARLITLFAGCASGDSRITPAIEMFASYGMTVGREVFETCVWIGRFHEAMGHAEYVYRKDIKIHLCNSYRAKDANIRQALLDRFPPTGGGQCPEVGTKSKPGPLFGVSKHIWSALAVAVFWHDTNGVLAPQPAPF